MPDLTPVYRGNVQVEGIFGRLGGVSLTRDEPAFDAVTAATATALIEPLFTLIGDVALWISGHLVDENVAREFVIGQFHSRLGLATDAPHQ